MGLVLLGIVVLAWVFKRFAPRAAAAFKSPCLEPVNLQIPYLVL